MEQAERDELRRWIEKSVALLAPPDEWDPIRRAAPFRREFPLRRALSLSVAALGIVCTLAVAIPVARVFASQAGVSWHAVDQLWYWIPLINRPQLVRLGRLPEEMRSIGMHPLTTPISPAPVSGLVDASQRAGFMPRMPDSGAMPGSPRLSVVGAASFGRTFSAAELESALRQAREAGVTDPTVPSTWDGAWVGVQIGPRVVAEWSDVADPATGAIRWSRMALTQSAPPVFQLPPGIDLTSFATLNLRATLMSANTARQFARDAVPAAALLLGKGALKPAGWESAFTVHYVSLRREPAVLVEEFGDPGLWQHGPTIGRLILLWSEPDRVYVLTGDLNAPLFMTGYDLAGAVASVVEIADQIQ